MTVLSALLILTLVLVLAFEIWIFIDALRNPKLDNTTRLLWLIGMVLIHPIVAILYFFTVRRPPLSS